MQDRLKSIRSFLAKNKIDAIVLRYGDEYFSEEVLPRDQVFRWLTGLEVSYGYVVISENQSTIFIDGRYILAAQETLNQYVWTVYNIKNLHPFCWIKNNVTGKIALNPKLHTINEVNNLKQVVNGHNDLVFLDIVDSIWENRPKEEESYIFSHPVKFAGEASESKIAKIKNHLNLQKCDAILISDPCDVAWVMNIRGNSLKYTPIGLARMLVFKDGSYKIYTDSHSEDIDNLSPSLQILSDLPKVKGKLLIDPSNTSYTMELQTKLGGTEIANHSCIVCDYKSIKNNVELDGARKAHIADGAAIINLLFWLNNEIKAGNEIFEADVATMIAQLRAKNDLYIGESFACIAAFGKNAANAHYKVSDRGAQIAGKGLFLLDTGGQYQCGTTDMTRTMCFDWPTLEEQDAYTRVLKGHIALANTVFPTGTTGYQLDSIARQYLWQVGMDYDHGTGHGIGSCLSVHEGPQNFSKKSSSDNALQNDMLITIEPGYYLKGKFGIRIENVNQIISLADLDNGEKFLTFAALTAVPMDFKLVSPALLTDIEKAWLKSYHEWVLNILRPNLSEKVMDWLYTEINPYFINL